MPLDCSKLTPDEREAVFGREFREVQVLSFRALPGGALLTTVVIAGQMVHLVGDPCVALNTLMSGQKNDEVFH